MILCCFSIYIFINYLFRGTEGETYFCHLFILWLNYKYKITKKIILLMLNIEGEALKGFGVRRRPIRAKIDIAPTLADSLWTFFKIATPATQNNNCISLAINNIILPHRICIIQLLYIPLGSLQVVNSPQYHIYVHMEPDWGLGLLTNIEIKGRKLTYWHRLFCFLQ